MTNALLQPWETPFGRPPFDQIEDAHFEPAFDAGIEEDKAEVAAIADNPDPATFENTIEALQATGATLDKVLSTFYQLVGTDQTPERERLQRVFSPKLAAHSTDITLNRALWDRIEAVWQARDALSGEALRITELLHRRFRRAGAALDGEGRDRLREINLRLAELGTAFAQNLQADERNWWMALSEDDLEGLPEFLVSAAAAAAKEKEVDGHVITASRSLLTPFLQFSPQRDLRQKAYAAWTSRGARGGETDNRALCAEMLSLRHERAQLLGYDDFASYKLETEMAKTPEAVRDLLMAVWQPAKTRADADAQILEAMMHKDGLTGPLEPWDWHYYSDKRRRAEHDLDEAEVKPYFQLDRMIEAAFECANRLFGLEFAPVDVPVHNADVRAWEVTRNGEHVALFFGDYFARGGKRSGAWCSASQSQRRFPDLRSPHVINVCNFAKPAEGQPALLSYDDARTLFHEFGHALHQMLSDVTYDMISGTSVPRDFVELPSQLYEHWLEVPEVLAEFATHAETGAPMPKDLLDRVLGAATYDMGFQTVEYVASALVDLEFHIGEPPADPMQKQAEVLQSMGMPRAISMRHATPHFAHVFAGGYYAASYYSYMWSEVMDADAFAAFEEAGGAFDPAMAKRLEADILSTGGTEEPDVLYTRFRGRLPGVDALLKGRGLDTAA